MKRRDFVVLASAAALLPRESRADRLERIGIQLYSVRHLFAAAPERTLSELAAIGYREVEFAGFARHAARDLKAMLDRTGLTAPAAHLDLSALGERWPDHLDDAGQLGCRYLVVASIPEQDRSLDGYRRIGERLNRAAERARAAGIRLAYHNHAFEFVRIGDQIGYDVLMSSADPREVLIELDLYWITKAGGDPLAYLTKWPGRVRMVHVKDMGPKQSMVDVGAGSIDFAKIFAHRRSAGIEHFFVEHDQPADPMAFARNSYAHLKSLTF
jgi:sugar phosphate isomerase/epimerase